MLSIVVLTTAIGGLLFQSTTFALPKIFEERLAGLAGSATEIGGYAFLVFAVAALAQIVVGYLVDRHPVRTVFAFVAGLQAVFFAIMYQLTGLAALIVALAFMLVVFGQIPINDVLVGRIASNAWRSRLYAIRYIVTFSVMASTLPVIAGIHASWGFSVAVRGDGGGGGRNPRRGPDAAAHRHPRRAARRRVKTGRPLTLTLSPAGERGTRRSPTLPGFSPPACGRGRGRVGRSVRTAMLVPSIERSRTVARPSHSAPRPPPIVMPGLVPGIHVEPPPRSLRARTAMPQDVDGRNKSGHDGGGRRRGKPGWQQGERKRSRLSAWSPSRRPTGKQWNKSGHDEEAVPTESDRP